MKKLICMLVCAAMLVSLTACGGSSSSGSNDGTEAAAPDIDYGTSEVYTQEDLEAAAAQVMETFSAFEGCEFQNLRYAGDEANNAENLEWLNSLNDSVDENGSYTQAAEFLMNFHSPVEQSGAWEPDADYTDYQFWLARTDGGDWNVVSWGY